MPGSLSEREREAAELFGHAEGRVPLNHSVVRLPGSVSFARGRTRTHA